MTTPLRRIALLLLLLACLAAVSLRPAAQATEPEGGQAADYPADVSLELFQVPGNAADEPSLLVLVRLAPHAGHYAYGHEPGPTGQPTTLSVLPLPGLDAHVYYPQGSFKPDIFDPTVEVAVYEAPTLLFVALHGSLPKELLLVGELSMLLCSDVSCWPVREELVLEVRELGAAPLPVAQREAWWPEFQALARAGATPPPAPSAQAPTAPAAKPAPTEDANQDAAAVEALEIRPDYFQPALEVHGVGKAALFALLAGFILNFMPCVLPVISLKLSALVAASGIGEPGAKTRGFREHNLFFAAGILLYFAFLGVVLGAAGLAWGQLFQKPGLIMGVTAVVFGLALSLFGVFTLPVVDLKARSGTKSPRTQALFTGMLATLLATPCSGPFLGGVLGWTLTQAPSTVVAVFLCIGLGMASPYLGLAVRPGLVRFFPKPGPWTVFLEHIVAFFLMGTCVYLLSILPDSYTVSALILLLGTALAAWIWGYCTGLHDPRGKRAAIRGLALLVLAATAFWAFQPPAVNTGWREFDQETFTQALGEQNILIDFTADWCPNCKVLEKTTLAAGNLALWQQRYGLLLLQADLTENNPAAQALLRKLGSQSIPVVALFPAGESHQQPLVLRDLFTKAQMEQALVQSFGH